MTQPIENRKWQWISIFGSCVEKTKVVTVTEITPSDIFHASKRSSIARDGATCKTAKLCSQIISHAMFKHS
eukprot:2371503-Amphidinium_carterae.1